MHDDRASRLARWPFAEGVGRTTAETVSGADHEIVTAGGDGPEGPREPRWPSGVTGPGLLFDGYSTAVTGSAVLSEPTEALTVEAWLSPRSFDASGVFDDSAPRLSPVVSQYDPNGEAGFALGLHRHGRWGCRVGDGTRSTLLRTDSAGKLQPYTWHHVAAVFDGTLTLYRDGEVVASTETDCERVAPADIACRLGKHPVESDGVFDRDTLDGVLDRVTVYDEALDATTIEGIYDRDCASHGGSPPTVSRAEVGLDSSVLADDPHRPAYHLVPPQHWMNEPHAPLYYDGRYHLFYQHNPSGPYWGNIHWGHWVSDDLVHWEPLPPALAPEADAVDPDGCWSGNATTGPDGTPTLFYTAGDTTRTPDQAVATATPADPEDGNLVEWNKEGLVLEHPGDADLTAGDFRDPFVWREDDTWYCLVGAGVEDEGGTALVYESADFQTWERRGHLHRADHSQYPFLGPVWELPVLLPVGTHADREKHVFLVSPVGPGADVEVFYWIGEWDPETCSFVPDHDDPRRIDYGDSHFTGPSGFDDPERDRPVLFTITQDDRRPREQYQAGWAHSGGLPVSLSLHPDGRLRVEAISELTALREQQLVDISTRQVSEANRKLNTIASHTVECLLELSTAGADRYGLALKEDASLDERTLVYYDERDGDITLHREQGSQSVDFRKSVTERSTLVHSGPLDLDDGGLTLRVFVDRSVVRCFANEHRSITTSVYSDPDNDGGLSVWADGDVTVERLRVWKLANVN